MVGWLSRQLRHFSRRFAVVGALLTLAELLAVCGPLFILFRFDAAQRALLDKVGPPTLVGGWLVWWIVMRVWRSPVDRAMRRRSRGQEISREHIQAIYRSTLELPRRAAWLRSGIAGVLGTGLGLLLYLRTPHFPAESIVTFGMVAFLHMHMVQVFRSLAYARILARVRDELIADVDPLRLFRDHYLGRLVRAALATGVLGLTAIAAFSYFFLPIHLEQYQRIETWFPFPVVALTTTWYGLARRLVRPVDRYLGAAISLDPREQPSGDDQRAVVAYRAAQSLPYKFAVATAALWLAADVVLVLMSAIGVFGIDFENAVLMFAEALVVTVAVALYQALWQRAIMRPLLAHIATRHRPRPEMVQTPVSMRAKMLGSFGGLTFFACGLSLFWSFVQYKNLATNYIQQFSALRLDRMVSDISRRAAEAGHPLTPTVVSEMLRAEARDEAVLYYLPAGDTQVLAFGGGKAGKPPALPWSAQALMRRLERGTLELSSLRLSGAHARLEDAQHHDCGSIAVLYPGYRGRGPSVDGQIKVLLYFFVMLAGASMGIVVLVVTDLTKPIHLLEQRAGAMAKGDLSRPVIHVAGEADEVGRLTFAFEEMRRALNEKLRSSTEINLSLELEVRRRTAELERRNQELNDALDALQHTQAELVRSAKLASMGRLVAGIAHEINNPVNAVVNTAGPLGTTLDELIAGLGTLPPTEIATLGGELREMLHVIQRGARRTKEIVQALHNYSRGDDDRLQVVDLHRGIDESLDLLRHHLKHGIRVERDYGEVGQVRGYAGQLNQVFMNLLTNAAQALSAQAEEHQGKPAGNGGPGIIRIATARQDDKVIIIVSDNGPGIPQDALPHIFDPFFTTKEVGQGSGLGLSIVHGIVERHGGTIAVDSEVGRGTRFTVTLPG